MELSPLSKTFSQEKQPEAFVKALYIGHKAISHLVGAHTIISDVEEMGIGLVEASELILTLYGKPTLIALRAQHYAVFDKLFANLGNESNSTDKIIAALKKNLHPDADAFVRCLKTIKARAALAKIQAEISTYCSGIDLTCFSCNGEFSSIGEFFSALMVSAHQTEDVAKILRSASLYMVAKTQNGLASETEKKDFTTESYKIQHSLYTSFARIFDKKQLANAIETLMSQRYAEVYADWYQQALTHNKSGFKKAVRVTLLNNESTTPPSKITVDGLGWKQAIKEKKATIAKLAQQSVSSQQTVKAADDSYVAEETSEYVVIEDPRNNMRITLYKTREPESEKAQEVGYHHRVSDLFMMDRAELVTKIATEKKISPLIANEAVRQKTPALIADQYIHYAHNDFFIDKSGQSVANKTLLCRIELPNKPTKEYFLIWGFLEDGSCYHRGLSFNSSLDESIKKLAEKARYDFDFPELEKSTGTKKDEKTESCV